MVVIIDGCAVNVRVFLNFDRGCLRCVSLGELFAVVVVLRLLVTHAVESGGRKSVSMDA